MRCEGTSLDTNPNLRSHSSTGQDRIPGRIPFNLHPCLCPHSSHSLGHHPILLDTPCTCSQADKPQRWCQEPRRWRSQKRRQPACSTCPQQGPCHSHGCLDSVEEEVNDGFLLLHEALCWPCISSPPISPWPNLPLSP